MVDDRTALMSARALSPGYEILWYTIKSVLGQGGFGITYLAHDRNLDRAVAIKEYLPTSFAYRRDDYSVKPITGDHRENFVWGLSSFQKEAQTLARFSHPNIVRVHSVFEENNTAYMVMEYEHGQSLAAMYKEGADFDQRFFEKVFFPIFDGLKEIHKFEFIHRDIKPANIYIREDGTPVLIDFGSARQTTQQQTSEITTLVSQGYTPLEQYSANYGDQGPWTDIYALAATIYEGIVGSKPDESLSRSACLMRAKPDLLEPLETREYPAFSQQFLNAVYSGLKLEPEGRPQSIEHWYQVFETGENGVSVGVQDSGFTALEADQTRLQPRRAVSESESSTRIPVTSDDFDSWDESGAHKSPMYETKNRDDYREHSYQQEEIEDSGARSDTFGSPEQMHARTDRHAVDDLLDFDDTDLTMHGTPRATPPNGRRVGHRRRSRGKGKVLAALVALIVLGAGGAYLLFTSSKPTSGISAATLSTMPRPTQSIQTSLPVEHTLEQLNEMANLAPLLAQAYSLNATDTDLLETIRRIESSLLSLATTWNATKYPDVASRISTVSNALPVAVHDRSRIQGILAASDQVSAYNQIVDLLADKSYLSPKGNAVLDRITAVNASDYQRLKGTSQWREMMSEFSRVSIEKLAKSDFDDVARLTEAALSLDAEDPGFIALRKFLAGS